MSEEHTETAAVELDHRREVVVVVDNEKVRLSGHRQTPRAIMKAAGIDPETHYLTIILEHGHQESLEGKTDEVIEIHDDERFVSAKTGPVPVS